MFSREFCNGRAGSHFSRLHYSSSHITGWVKSFPLMTSTTALQSQTGDPTLIQLFWVQHVLNHVQIVIQA